VLASCADIGSPLPHPLALHERFAIPADLGGNHAQRASPTSANRAQATPPLSLDHAWSWSLELPTEGSLELPTEGSLLHNNGCKPCVFLHKEGGCKTGSACKFCHLCQPDEKKIRKKTWKHMKRLETSISLAPEDGGPFDDLFQSAL